MKFVDDDDDDDTIAGQEDNAGSWNHHSCWDKCICTGTAGMKRVMRSVLTCDAS